MSFKASIDIGSNSTLLLIVDEKTKIVELELSEITSLGKDLDKNNKFLESSMDDTYNALCAYVKECEKRSIKPNEIIATATEASRVATNAKDFYQKVLRDLGLKVTLITGEGEAYFTALGISKMLPSLKEGLIMDIGGASTELIKFETNPFQIVESVSLPIGSVRVTDWRASSKLDENLKSIFEKYRLESYKGMDVICVAGTMTSLALMMQELDAFESDNVNRYQAKLDEYEFFVNNLLPLSSNELESKYSFLGKRVKTIQGGALGALEVLRKIEAKDLYFSTYGLRYGTALSGGINENYCI